MGTDTSGPVFSWLSVLAGSGSVFRLARSLEPSLQEQESLGLTTGLPVGLSGHPPPSLNSGWWQPYLWMACYPATNLETYLEPGLASH